MKNWRTIVENIKREASWDNVSLVNLLLDFIDGQPEYLAEELIAALQKRRRVEIGIYDRIDKLNQAANELRKEL